MKIFAIYGSPRKENTFSAQNVEIVKSAILGLHLNQWLNGLKKRPHNELLYLTQSLMHSLEVKVYKKTIIRKEVENVHWSLWICFLSKKESKQAKK